MLPVAASLTYTPTCSSRWTGGSVNGMCASSSAALPGGSSDVAITVPPALLAAFTTYSSSGVATTSVAGAGLAATDFVIYVTAKATASCGSGGSGTMAYASTLRATSMTAPPLGASTSAQCTWMPLPLPGARSWARQCMSLGPYGACQME